MNVRFSFSTSYSLVDRSIDGETDAWMSLSDIYAPMIYKWVRNCGIQPDDANEITQKTFVKVFQNLRSFEKGQGRFRGWLWTISRNLVRDFAEERSRRHATIDPIDIEKIERKPWDAVESAVPPKEILRRAIEHLEHDLDERSRMIVQEVIMADRQPKIVADELGVSVNTVYIVKSRAIRKFRKLLADVEYSNMPDDDGKSLG